MRIGYFGGSFDPPHVGHLAVARAALAAFGLDEVLFVPTGHQPLKPVGAAATYADRLAMTTLLCDSQPSLRTLDLEAPTPGNAPNYTIDTLRRLQRLHPAAEIFVIVGADAFLTLRAWRAPEELLEAAQWIVVSRPGAALEQRMPSLALTSAQLAHVHPLTGVAEPASATEIRRLLRGRSRDQAVPASAGPQLRAMLPAAVLTYILDHGLYL